MSAAEPPSAWRRLTALLPAGKAQEQEQEQEQERDQDQKVQQPNTDSTSRWLRAAATRLSTGNVRAVTLITSHSIRAIRNAWTGAMTWLRQGEGVGWLLRLVALLAAAVILRTLGEGLAGVLWALIEARTALLWVAAALWVVSAWRCGHPTWTPNRPAVDHDDQETDTTDTQADAPSGLSVAALISAARKLGTPHAHIAAIATELDVSYADVRDACTAAGIPVDTVRMSGRGSSTGIKAEHLPPLPHSEKAPNPVVGAGQSNNNTTTTGVRVEELGGGGYITYHPEDSHRRTTIQ